MEQFETDSRILMAIFSRQLEWTLVPRDDLFPKMNNIIMINDNYCAAILCELEIMKTKRKTFYTIQFCLFFLNL